MGCVSSKKDINDQHPNIFKVMNVDDHGQLVSPGQLEITETEMILYQRGKQIIRWPLAYIRRYGFDSEHFSFESGRRCDTGPGIYAFRCRRAEQLFNLLHQHVAVQGSQNDEVFNLPPNSEFQLPITSSGPAVPTRPTVQHSETILSSYLDPQNPRVQVTRTPSVGFVRLNSITSNGPLSPPAITPPLVSSPEPTTEHNNNKRASLSLQHSYSNTLLPSESETLGNIIPPYMNVEQSVSPSHSTISDSYAQLNLDQEANCSHLYVNISPGDITPAIPISSVVPTKYPESSCIYVPNDVPIPQTRPLIEEKEEEPRHCYANLETEEIEGLRSKFIPTEHIPPLPQTPPGGGEVNYATLDLDKAKDEISTNCALLAPDSPKKQTKGYALIDFDKTVALSHSVNPSQELDSEGSRKTRHNSTISDLGPISTRHSSSLSD